MNGSSLVVVICASAALCLGAWSASGAAPFDGLRAGSAGAASGPPTVDLTSAVVVTAGADADSVERQAALMLCWEVRKRTGLGWLQGTDLPSDDRPVIIVGSRERLPALPAGLALPEPVLKEGKAAAEGYVVMVDTKSRPGPTVCCIGNDRRGTLFAVGRLLRALEWGPGGAKLPAGLKVSTAPASQIRGMELGYRELNDTLDGWDVAQYAQYVRDLIVFGNNTVVLIPPVAPGVVGVAVPDPLMPMTTWDMTVALSALLDAYDMQVWLWMPLEVGAAEDPQRRQVSLRERQALYAACRRVDNVFVPGRESGGAAPQILMPYLRDLAVVLRRSHPQAGLWVAPQKFDRAELAYFYEYLRKEQPEWLTGVIWGPGCADTLQHTREAIPLRYPILRRSDITHAKVCQFPVPYWDEAWAQAYERQPIQPRPTQYAHICNLYAPFAVGAYCYSDGTGDDVNKVMVDARLWDPQADVREVLREYGRYFVGPEYAEGVAEGLLMLEQNWSRPASDPRVLETLAHWQALEKRATPQALGSWRFQQGLMRAYGDAFVHTRVVKETALLDRAYAELRRAREVGPDAALDRAEQILQGADPLTAAPELRQRIHELADLLFDSIRIQLSIKKHGSNSIARGAQLDNNDAPLTDCAWLRLQVPEVRKLTSDREKLAAIDAIVNWTDPGPGGFYDDLGNHANGKDPHLVRDITWEQDPGFMQGVEDTHWGVYFPQSGRLSWENQAQTNAAPLRLRYEGLDPHAAYLLRATYAGRGARTLQLYMGDQPVGEPVVTDSRKPQVREFDVPASAIVNGVLQARWEGVTGGGAQIAEVWLMRKK